MLSCRGGQTKNEKAQTSNERNCHAAVTKIAWHERRRTKANRQEREPAMKAITREPLQAEDR